MKTVMLSNKERAYVRQALGTLLYSLRNDIIAFSKDGNDPIPLAEHYIKVKNLRAKFK